MIARVVLGLLAFIFIPYGLYCLVSPEMLSGAAGLTANSTTGTIELQTMYGGLQTSVGVMCALGAFNAKIRTAALLAMVFIFAGLAVVRVTLGLSGADYSAYTVFAMVFETVSLLLCAWLYKRSSAELG